MIERPDPMPWARPLSGVKLGDDVVSYVSLVSGLGYDCGHMASGGGVVGTPIDVEKIRGLMVGRSGSQPRTAEFRRPDGVRCKRVTDDLGHVTTFHSIGDTERVDVLINARSVSVTGTTNQEGM